MIVMVVIYFICALLLVVYGINAHLLVQLFTRRYPECIKTDKAFLETFLWPESTG